MLSELRHGPHPTAAPVRAAYDIGDFKLPCAAASIGCDLGIIYLNEKTLACPQDRHTEITVHQP